MVFCSHQRGIPKNNESEELNMLTSLDLLVIAFMGLAALTLLSLCLMFLIKNKTAKRIFFYVVLATSLLLSYIGLHIGITGWFTSQIFLGAITVIMSIFAFVLERISKGDEKKLRISRILGAASLILAMANAFFI